MKVFKLINYKLFLISTLSLFLFMSNAFSKDVNDLQQTRQKIIETYGANDLSSKAPFQGGYINFGYWKDISVNDHQQLSKQDRVNASLALYRHIFNYLNIKDNDRIIEAGCGLGYGCKYMVENYNPSEITCVDVTPEQIQRAKITHKNVIKKFKSLAFLNASADEIKRPSNSYDKIYSVEAAQYFPSMEKFAQEAHRLLKPQGMLVITAHFSTSPQGYEAAKKLLPTVEQNIDRMIPIEEVRSAFRKAGFNELKLESIGQFVFKGFDHWISQVEDAPWAHNIYKLYQQGNIDYYVLVLQKK